MNQSTNVVDGAPRRARIGASRRWTAVAAAAALTLTLGACVPRIHIETELEGPSVAVRPESSGVILFVRVPESRPRGGLEVATTDGRTFFIPPGHYPPPGTCRVWDPGMPPGQQALPGDCSELERRVPAGHYLVYG